MEYGLISGTLDGQLMWEVKIWFSGIRFFF